MKAGIALFSVCALLAVPCLASADEPEDEEIIVGPAEPELGPLEWDPALRRFRPWEYAIGPALVTEAFLVYLVAPDPDFDFAAGNRFDQSIQDAISVRSTTYRSVANVVGDIGFYGSMAYRALEDVLVVGVARDGWPVASQFVAMDTMAFGLVGAVVWTSQVFVGRQRPSAYYCAIDPAYAERFGDCDRFGGTRSFLSGHFAAAVAGASLTCLYHRRFQIYRRPRGDAGACGATIAFAVLTGVARSTGDGHWMTDMLGGGALGFLSGWVLPRAVLFGFREPSVESRQRSASRVTVRVQPTADRGAGGVEARGWF